MTTIGAFEAKTHFSNLLKKVRKGEKIIITYHNEPVAEIQPYTQAKSEMEKRVKVIDKIKLLGQKSKLGNDLSLADLIQTGRK